MQTENNKFRIRLSASESRAVYEVRLHYIWNNVSTSHNYIASGGHRIKVISPGTWNVEAGPDFLNAGIEIDDKRVNGDIEIHYRASDWFAHKHQFDRRYNNVILHVIEMDDVSGKKAESLPPALKFSDLKMRKQPEEQFHKGKCSMFFSALSDDSVSALLCAAGVFRFQTRAEDMLSDSLHNGADYACLKQIFRAFGYKKNQDNFTILFERFQKYPEDVIKTEPEVVLWGESGLLPDPATTDMTPDMTDFVRNMWARWGKLRRADSEPVKWVRSGIRPYNSPERRIAALAVLLNNIGIRPLAFFAEQRAKFRTPDQLKRYIMTTLSGADDLWNRYINFRTETEKPAVVTGKNLALELALNVILPSLFVFGRMDKENLYDGLQEFAQAAWMLLPATQDNRIVKIAVKRWMPERNTRKILSSAASRQGVLHLYREYCEKCQADCNACILYNSL